MASENNICLALLAKAIGICDTAFLIVDAIADDLPIVYANNAFTELTGYKSEEVLGRNCRFLQGEDRDQPELDIVRQALERQVSCQVILRNYRKDGTLFLNELTITPLHDRPRRVTHFVGGHRKLNYENLESLRNSALDRLDRLTNRERQVLWMLVDGNSNKAVAEVLEISPRTAEKHRQHILHKMEVGSVAMLTRYALAAGYGALSAAE